MVSFTLRVKNPAEYETDWYFLYKAESITYEPGIALEVGQVYTLVDVPPSGYLSIWKLGYLVGETMYRGWKEFISRQPVTFENGETYELDFLTGEIQKIFSPMPIITKVIGAIGAIVVMSILGVMIRNLKK